MVAKHPRRRPARVGRVAPTRRRSPVVAEVAGLEPRLLLSALPTTTTLAASPMSPAANQAVTLTATVADGPGNPTPTGGSVTFRSGSATLGSVPLVNGSAQLTTGPLPTALYTFSAEYSGAGSSFLGSSSVASAATRLGISAGNVLFGDNGPAASAFLSGDDAVAVDAAGNLYIADPQHTVVREVIAATGAIVTVAGNYVPGYTGDGGAATSASLSQPEGVAVDGAGNLFIADTFNNVIREVKAGTGKISTVATGLNVPRGLATDAAGNLYIADTGDNVIKKLSPAGVLTVVAGSGAAGYAGDGVPGGSGNAQFNGPAAVAVQPGTGNILIADTNNNVIRQLSGTTVTTVVNGLNAPQGVAADGSGNIFVANTGGNTVLRVNGATRATIAGTGTPGYGGDGGVGTAALLKGPQGMALSSAGRLYIADTGNNLVRMIAGVNIATVAGAANPSRSGEGGAATTATLFTPQGVATDALGDLFIVDSSANAVRKVAPGGVITTVAGAGPAGFSGDGGQAVLAQLNSPRGVAVDAAGNLYIADTNDAVIRKVSAAGVISTFAGTPGQFGNTGDGGPATSAKIGGAWGVAADAAGDVFIADTSNNEVREVTPDGIIHDFAGAATGGGTPSHVVALNLPKGIATDAAGDVFIADTGNNRVVEIRKSDGAVIVVAGTGTAGDTGDGGLAAAATLNAPRAVTADALGDVFIADGADNGVRMVTPSGIILTVGSTQSLPGPGGQPTPIQPTGVAVDPAGTLEISDSFSAVVRKAAVGPLFVGKTTTTTIAGPSTFSGVSLQSMNVFARVDSPVGAPLATGSVQFMFGSTLIATEPLVAASGYSFATLPTIPYGVGTYTFTTIYTGDTNHLGSQASTTFTVVKANTSVNVGPSAFGTLVRGQSLAINAIVSIAAPGAGSPTGTVTFRVGSTVIATEPVVSNGSVFYAQLPPVPYGVGNYSITATYNGDAADNPSTGTTNFSVVAASTTTVAVASSTTPTHGQAVTLTAGVLINAPGSGLATGTITFKDGSTTLGTGSLTTVVNGVAFASFTTSALSVGPHSITAVYGGDAGDTGSTSTAFTVTVGAGGGAGGQGLAAAPAFAAPLATAPAVAPAAPILLASAPPVASSSSSADRAWLAAIEALADERLG